MKNLPAFLFLFGLLLFSGCFQQQPEENSTTPVRSDQADDRQKAGQTDPSLVQAKYDEKIVYENPGSDADMTPYQDDCEVRDGTFLECGNGCAPDADFCAAVCVPVCRLEKGAGQ